MKAFVFKGSNEFIGKFDINTVDELPAMLVQFVSRKDPIPLFSYVEVQGRRWTITGLSPLRFQEGDGTPQSSGPPPAKSPEAIAQEQGASRRIVDYGVGLAFGGLYVLLKELVGGQFNAHGFQLGILGFITGALFSKSIRAMFTKNPVYILLGLLYLILFTIWLIAMIRGSM